MSKMKEIVDSLVETQHKRIDSTIDLVNYFKLIGEPQDQKALDLHLENLMTLKSNVARMGNMIVESDDQFWQLVEKTGTNK